MSNAPAETGSGSSGGGNNTTANHEKAAQFAECIRANDLAEFPDPDASGEFACGINVIPAVWKKAVDACPAPLASPDRDASRPVILRESPPPRVVCAETHAQRADLREPAGPATICAELQVRIRVSREEGVASDRAQVRAARTLVMPSTGGGRA